MPVRTNSTVTNPPGTVTCPADCGVKVDIVYPDRMVWVIAEESKVTVVMALDDFADAGYSVKARTLGIALDSSLGYVEIPCSRQQAENILTHIGWDLSRLHVHYH